MSGIGAAYNKESLQQHGITHIMTVAYDCKRKFSNDFTYLYIPALDTLNCNILKYFDKTN